MICTFEILRYDEVPDDVIGAGDAILDVRVHHGLLCASE